LQRRRDASIEIFRRPKFLLARIFCAHAIRTADVSTLHQVQRFIVRAAKEKAAQIRLGKSPTRRKMLLLCRLADRSRRFTIGEWHYHWLAVRTPMIALGHLVKLLF
jgi:hypothetical protein